MHAQRILLVEDEPDIQKVAKLSLTLVGGYDVAVVDNGIEAIRLAEQLKPDVILLDVMLPDMDGYETLTRMKQHDRLKDIPVLFMSAKAQQKEVSYGLSLGAIGYIIKPFDPMTLPAQVQQFLQVLEGRPIDPPALFADAEESSRMIS